MFEVDANTVHQWLVEAAAHLKAFSRYFLCNVHVRQVQRDELYAVRRDVKDGKLSEDDAINRLERSRQLCHRQEKSGEKRFQTPTFHSKGLNH